MADLISPGVSVTIIDQSFYIPATAITVPLIFLATKEEKILSDLTGAVGTYESDVVRTITSISQSISLYGIPKFLYDTQGLQQHGDARNEYGLFALNQFLNIGARAYVVRANIDLDDNRLSVLSSWASKSTAAANSLEALATALINEYNNTNGYIPIDVNYKTTIDQAEFMALSHIAMGTAYNRYLFSDRQTNPLQYFSLMFEIDHTTSPLPIYEQGYDHAATGNFIGLAGIASAWSSGVPGIEVGQYITGEELVPTLNNPLTNTIEAGTYIVALGTGTGGLGTYIINQTQNVSSGPITTLYGTHTGTISGTTLTITAIGTATGAWLPSDASDMLLLATEMFQYTTYFLNSTSLGATDAIRRQSIVNVLQATINSNQEIKSEMYEYNLMVCPGYPECVDELINLSNSIKNEAFTIADTPMNLNPENVVNWSNTTGVAPNVRVRSRWAAYYYPHGYASNLDGNNVVCAASGVALAVYTYSDSVSQLWFAPAGENRGLVTDSTGVTAVGYVNGTLGSATTFVAVSLNQGQRDAMYGTPAFLNPIYDSPGTGIAVWGQRTSVPGDFSSAMDRVNVVRLTMYIKRSLRKSLVQFLFEPNDQITRDNVVSLVKSFLHDIQVKRGLYDFAVLCDDSNNTPDSIDRSELWVDIALKPVKAVEFIYVPIRIVNTGAKLTG